MCREVFPNAEQGLCFFHVRQAINKRLNQKLRGNQEAKTADYNAINDCVEDIMYMHRCGDKDATRAEVQRKLEDFRAKCVACDVTA